MPRFFYALLAGLLSFEAAAEETPSYQSLMETAQAAFQEENWQTVSESLNAAQMQRPYSLYLTRNRILAYTMLDETDAALALLQKCAERGLSLSLTGHEAFETLKALPAYTPIAAKMEANAQPHGAANTVHIIEDTGLLPETLSAAGKDAFFIGSVRTGKIMRIDAEGPSGFAIADGGVYDLEKDSETLFAAVNTASPYERPIEDGEQTARILAFDLKSGANEDEYVVAAPDALLGDLQMTPAGLIASDSVTPRLFILRPDQEAPEIFSIDQRYVNLQGMAYDEKRNRLYVADYLAGLFSVDPDTGEATLVGNVADAHLGGIDGLYLHDGDLVGIQNGTTPQRIVRIGLNETGDAADNLEVVQQALPDWREPTNGKVMGTTLYYIGTSNWPAYGQDGAVKQDVERAPVKIMTAPL